MALVSILFLLFLVVLGVYANAITVSFVIIVGVLLFGCTSLIWGKNDNTAKKVFAWAYLANFAYSLFCFIYMRSYDYSYLLTFDTDHIIMPNINHFLESDSNYYRMIYEIWTSYTGFDRFQVGYYTYLCTWGYVAKLSGADLYFIMQLSHFSFASFLPVFLYKILQLNKIPQKDAFRYSLVMSLCSVLFFYSSTIIRDGLITTIVIYIYYVMMHKINLMNVFKIAIAAYLVSILRIESGLFCIIYIPVYYLIWSENNSKRGGYAFIFMLISGFFIFFFFKYFDRVLRIYENNYDIYVEGVEEGSGVIGLLHKIPVLGDLVSIVYIALLPMPCWTKMFVSKALSRPECYNIMTFPLAIAAFFNLYITVYLTNSFFKYKRIIFNQYRSFKFLLIPAILLLYLQSAVVAQRRVMFGYVVFYLIWAVIHHRSSRKVNGDTLVWTVFIFGIIQILTALR